MPTNIADVSTFTDPIQGPADSDPQNAASYNLGMQGLANRTRHLKGRVDAIEPYFDADGYVQFDPAVQLRRTIGLATGRPLGTAWSFALNAGSYVWQSAANFGELLFPLNADLGVVSDDGAVALGNVSIVQLTVFWKPGAARTGTNRMLLSLITQTVTAGAPATTLVASANGDASTTSWHSTALTPVVPLSLTHLQDAVAVVNAGNDGGSSPDLVGRLLLTCTRTRMKL